jgi:hypothetical protein
MYCIEIYLISFVIDKNYASRYELLHQLELVDWYDSVYIPDMDIQGIHIDEVTFGLLIPVLHWYDGMSEEVIVDYINEHVIINISNDVL